MKVLIISDTHRNDVNLVKVLEKEKPIDLLIHCGDIEGSEKFIENTMECPVEMVVGNNDFFSNLPKEKEGKVASYIPALAEVNPKQLGVALYDLDDGEIGEAGQSEVRFAIESISKVITLMLAIKKMGIQEVFKHVGSRQSGFAFDSILNWN